MELNLDYYQTHPIYGKFFEVYLDCLGSISKNKRQIIGENQYASYLDQVELHVDQVRDAIYPKIELNNTLAYYHDSMKIRTGYGTNIEPITCLLAVVFVMSLFEYSRQEDLANIQDTLLQELTYLQAAWEHCAMGNQIWEIAKEYRSTPEEQTIIDSYRKRIEQLETELNKYRTDDVTLIWKEMVEKVVLPFDSVMEPAGFYELPKVKRLARPGQCELILKLMASFMPYKAALIHELGLMEFWEERNKDQTQVERLRTLESVLGLSPDNRQLRGNLSVFHEGSKENMTKYTALKHESEAKQFLDSLPLRPS